MEHRLMLALISILAWSAPLRGDESLQSETNRLHHEILILKTAAGTSGPAAYFDGTGDRAVVFVPGAVFDKESWFDLAGQLQQLQIASLSLDGKTPNDVIAAIGFLREKGFEHIVLVGGSMGGGAVLNALESGVDERVDKVVLLAPAGGNPIKSARISKLFIVSRADRLGLYGAIQQLHENSSEPKKLLVFDGSEHAQHLFKSDQKDGLSKAIVDFISSGRN